MKHIFTSSGWLLINKPEGVESFGVIRELKFRYKFSKIGFAGTLDPLASGLLLIAINKATKLISKMHLKNKIYQVRIFFGAETKTQDIEGRYINYQYPSHTKDKRLEMLKKFIGTYQQKIPIFSAHKIKGKNFYELARKEEVQEEKYKQVNIDSLKILKQNNNYLDVNIECETGFYVRSFAEEFSKSLGDMGMAMNIIRTKIGDFNLSDSLDFENILDFSHINDLDSRIITIYSGRHPG
ncbi:tRNA pseudouridine(55) synthase TruB [Alphaproteobacteria bacterium]|nr:tRNA pseudouridine(55) synthase TruB [Alphaproteobacteria bacterium]MDB9824498.1 tRNA pseudouridine(55) synthase TruB [Alphaproteobacteria bacterium]